MEKRSLVDMANAIKTKSTPKTIIYQHRSEIETLLGQGWKLKAIYEQLLRPMYAQEIESGKIKLSKAYFYKIWQSIITAAAQQQIKSVTESSPPQSTGPKSWDKESKGALGVTDFDWTRNSR